MATADKSSEFEPGKKGQTDREFKDRSAELGVSFDEFYKKFKPSLNAILAKARRSFSETPGNDIEAEWQSAADKALVKAYMKYPATGGKAVIFVGTSHDGKRLEVITRLDEYENPQADLTKVTVLATKKEAKVPPLKPLSEVVEAVAQHQAAGFSPSTNDNIPKSGEKSSDNLEFMRKRLHRQINPVVRDGVVRDEYADLLSVKEYTPETLEKWSKEAMEWILKQGGVKPAAEQFLENHAPAEKHVATLARRMIINSDVYANAFSYEQRVELNEQEIEDRSSWGKQGRAMQLAALKLDDIAAPVITAHAVGALNKDQSLS